MNNTKLYPYEEEHNKILRRLAPECMVLLASDGSFPLTDAGNIALYGSGARRTIKGGTGSGDVNVRHYTTVEEGLENAGFSITTKKWMDQYEEIWQQAHKQFVADIKQRAADTGVPAIMLGMGAVMTEPEYSLPLDGEGDTAIYVFSRISGEGSDRQAVAGDLQMTQSEIRDILTLSKKHKRFLLVLNVGGVVDLSPVCETVQNILILSQLGTVTGEALADVILGKSYPSGRLTTTWAAWEQYCSIGEFGERDDTRYREGIYVGYRYFDTVNRKPLYPFGYGLGYTTFTITQPSVRLDQSQVTVTASVKNTGNIAGKEVVQLYVSVPSVKLDQPYQELAAFAKTRELTGGATQDITLQFHLAELAAYDTVRAAYVLEAGDYILRIGDNSRNTHICGILRLEEESIVRQLEHVGGTPDFEDWIPEAAGWNYVEEKAELAKAPVYVVPLEAVGIKESADDLQANELTAEELKNDLEIDRLLDTFTDKELAWLCIGNYRSGEESSNVIGDAALTVAGAAGETSDRFKNRGISHLVLADGPAGLRLNKQYGMDEQGIYSLGDFADNPLREFIDEQVMAALGLKTGDKVQRNGQVHDQYCTAIPIGTALAQSWNPAVAESCGDIVGSEMLMFGVHLWLAPALNIHRSPLCGRNFEYYSEDPLISGKMAAAVTKGVQKHPGCGVTIKHFVCNNQETNRFRSNSIVSERALREIYMRGFQITVQESQPCSVMTSYNLLNGEHTAHRSDLNETVLREEWGFKGIVMSDWVIAGILPGIPCKYPYACASGTIKSGNDLMMPGCEADMKDIMQALNDTGHNYPLLRADLIKCAARVVKMVHLLTAK